MYLNKWAFYCCNALFDYIIIIKNLRLPINYIYDKVSFIWLPGLRFTWDTHFIYTYFKVGHLIKWNFKIVCQNTNQIQTNSFQNVNSASNT